MSRDYQEDQKNELEALESIYFDELQILEEEDRKKFKISVCTDEFKESNDGLACDLVFEYTPKYPDEKPKIEIEEENFESDIKEKLLDAINQTIEENIGMEMIFGIVGCAQEHLNTLFDQIKIDRELAKELKEKEEEEKERKKFEGTRVTVETFMKWRTDFEQEMGIAAQRAKDNDANRKPTGKELFMRDKSLLDSDILFLQSQGDSVENVKIDESLFQNLDLNEELPSDSESDDPDWKPS